MFTKTVYISATNYTRPFTPYFLYSIFLYYDLEAIILQYGHIRINVDHQLAEKNLSKNKLCQRAELQRTQLNKYLNNDIVLLNIDVLARICTVLECEVSDILEFIPPKNS